MALALSALLTHQLATDEAASSNLALSRSLQQLQTQRWISVAQSEADANDALTSEKAASVVHRCATSILHVSQKLMNPCLSRWQLRITSLVNSKSSTAAQAAGFSLAIETSRQSVTLFYQYSKPWYNQAITLLSVSLHAAFCRLVSASPMLIRSIAFAGTTEKDTVTKQCHSSNRRVPPLLLRESIPFTRVCT